MQLPNLNKMKNLVNRLSRYFTTGWALLPLALQSLRQNRSRSILTMIGIVIGVAAVLAMVTVGAFTKRKILDSYADLGVNTVVFYGRPNWELRATDQVPTVFQAFDWERDLIPIKRIFPQVLKLSPILQSWDNKVTFGGITIDSDVRGYGVSEDGLKITKRELAIGHNFSPFHIQNRSAVCIIGYEIYERLFSNVSPLGQIVYLIQRDSSFGCRVIGVLKSQTSNNDWNKPNLNVYLPYTFFQGISDPWNSRIHQVVMDIQSGSDIERVGLGVKSFFERKYGKSGHFRVGSDSVLIAQMNKFLSLFTVLLGAIAMVSLAVGGIGITNMMLVSVSERLKEIGIRKAFGATDFSIRVQYLVESIGICSVAGLVGLVAGFVLYQGAIYGATKLVPKLQFEWIIHFPALLLSILSIFLVGVLSGLVPAFKAERLQVIEALRSD